MMTKDDKTTSTLWHRIMCWWFPASKKNSPEVNTAGRVDWIRGVPFIGMHLGCLLVLAVGWSWPAVAVAALLYAARVFALTGFYHRYFSHRAFKTSRVCHFLFGALGCCAVQRGPLWWAAHHRHHHVHSDDEYDLHSPVQRGFWWSHMAWFLTPKALPINKRLIPDLLKFPELRLLDRIEMIIPLLFAGALYGVGALLESLVPHWGATGWQILVWGFFVSTILVYHVTYLVNSAAHLLGSRRFETKDDSRNNFWVAILTFGEGWHNNHHHYPNSARQGFYWYEMDITYYILKAMSWCGLVWDLRPVPKHILKPKAKEPAATAMQPEPSLQA